MTTIAEQLYVAGQAAHPQLRVGRDRFDQLIDGHVAAGGEALLAHAGDLFLAVGCLEGEPVALKTMDALLRAAAPALRQIDSSTAFADEVLQQLRHRLLVPDGERPPRIADYAGRGPLGAWLRVAAVRTGLNLQARMMREHGTSSSDDEDMSVMLTADDPALALARRQSGAEFQEAFRAACTTLTERQRTLLRMRYVDDLSADEIGAIYGVHRVTATRWLTTARDELFEATRSELETRLKLAPDEFVSVVRLVLSRLDVSISTILGGRKE